MAILSPVHILVTIIIGIVVTLTIIVSGASFLMDIESKVSIRLLIIIVGMFALVVGALAVWLMDRPSMRRKPKSSPGGDKDAAS